MPKYQLQAHLYDEIHWSSDHWNNGVSQGMGQSTGWDWARVKWTKEKSISLFRHILSNLIPNCSLSR